MSYCAVGHNTANLQPCINLLKEGNAGTEQPTWNNSVKRIHITYQFQWLANFRKCNSVITTPVWDWWFVRSRTVEAETSTVCAVSGRHSPYLPDQAAPPAASVQSSASSVQQGLSAQWASHRARSPRRTWSSSSTRLDSTRSPSRYVEWCRSLGNVPASLNIVLKSHNMLTMFVWF